MYISYVPTIIANFGQDEKIKSVISLNKLRGLEKIQNLLSGNALLLGTQKYGPNFCTEYLSDYFAFRRHKSKL